MIWHAKAVNRSSKCNPGTQLLLFELSPSRLSHDRRSLFAVWSRDSAMPITI